MDKIWAKNYVPGVPDEVDTSQYGSVVQVLDESFAKFADRPMFHNMGKTLSYADVDEQSRKFASYLQNDLRLSAGDRVAIMMPNILQYPVALFGILRAGMVAVNVNPLYTARELQHQLKDSGSKAIVIFTNSANILEKIIGETDVRSVIVTSIGDMLGFPKSAIVNFVIKNVKKMVPDWNIPRAEKFVDILKRADGGSFKAPQINQNDTAFLQYTGGTTGVSKGAILSHGNIVANIIQARTWIEADVEEGAEIIITPLPLYHIFSLTANCMVFSSVGAMNVLITNPRDIPGFVKELKNWKFTAITGVNTLFNGLCNNADFANLDFSHLKVVLGGGMAVQGPVAERWKSITGKTLVEAYGLTETSPAAVMNPMNLQDYNGFIGLPIPSTLVSIRNDQNNEVPLDEVGEICLKGPQVMVGYWQRPEATAEVMTDDGFFKTGDLGFMNSDGYVKLVDRKKDMILVSGFNVYPNEIEDVVARHDKVFECAVIGIPDEKSGEVVKLFIVTQDDSLTKEEIIAYCRDNMTSYKVPKVVEFRDDLPKSNVGKVLRKDLRE